MSAQQHIISTIRESRVLTSEQKELLLVDPQLPVAYRKKIASLLQNFDKHSKAREAYLRDKLEQLYTEFILQLETENVGEEKKKELLEKARKQIGTFFPKTANQS